MDTIQFEAIKTGLRQSKDGYNLTLAVHPDDLPDDLMRDFVGSRYVVVMVRVGDDEQPVVREKSAGEKAVALAGMLCRDEVFWRFLDDVDVLPDSVHSEDEAVEALCEMLEIDSRKDLKENSTASKRLFKIKERFDSWKS